MGCAKEIQFSNAEKCRRWRLLKKWTAYRQPQDDHQRALIERIVTAQVVLERLRFLQDEDCAENRLAARNWIEAHPEDRDRLEAMATTGLTVEIMRFSVRHESHWSRVLFQSLDALDAAQKAASEVASDVGWVGTQLPPMETPPPLCAPQEGWVQTQPTRPEARDAAQCALPAPEKRTEELPTPGFMVIDADGQRHAAQCSIQATEEIAQEAPAQEVTTEAAAQNGFAVVVDGDHLAPARRSKWRPNPDLRPDCRAGSGARRPCWR